MESHTQRRHTMPFFSLPRFLLYFFSSHRNYLLCSFAGFLTFLGQYPLTWLAAFYVGVAIIVYSCQQSERITGASTNFLVLRSAFLKGFYFAMGFFVPSFYWITNSFSIHYATADSGLLVIGVSIIGVLTLSAFMASFFGLGFILSLCFPLGFARLFAMVGFFAFADYIRGHILTGLPWNSFGYTWGSSDALMQTASILGVESIGVWALLFAALSSCFLSLRTGRTTLLVSLASLALLMAVQVWGQYRIGQLTAEASVRHDIGFRLIQPNIRQDKKWDAYQLSQNLGKMLYLSKIERPSWVRHILWPETAAPFVFLDSPTAREATQTVTPAAGTISLGSPRLNSTDLDSTEQSPHEEDLYYNSLLTLDKHNKLISHYDKRHLVPFGEYTPLGIFALERIIGRLGAYSPQTAPQALLDTAYFPPALVAVCFEILFPGEMLSNYQNNASNKRPQWLLNVSNDAWFGTVSLAPYQHMSMARWRSVELGLPLVRVNNTGVSGVVDALGRVIAERQVDEVGIIDFKLPFALTSPTIYTFLGFESFFISLLIVLSTAFLLSYLTKLQKTWQKERSSLL